MVKQTTTAPDMENVNFNYEYNSGLSFDELYNLFMKMEKEDLARLLAAKEIARTNLPQLPYIPVYPQPVYPSPYPGSPYPWITWNITC